jgi:hypothetical protein
MAVTFAVIRQRGRAPLVENFKYTGIPRMSLRTGVDGSNFLDWPEAWVRGVDGFDIPLSERR